MKRKVLLVYPPIDDDYFVAGVNDSPPLGLVALQNYVHRHLDGAVRMDLVDGEHCTVQDICNQTRAGGYDLVGLQPMMASYRNSLEISAAAKQAGAVTCFGGHHATHLACEIMRNRRQIVDLIVVGDGEEAMLGLIEEKSRSQIPNLVYFDRRAQWIHATPTRNVPLDDGKITRFDRGQLSIYQKNSARFERKADVSFRAYSHKGCSNRTHSQYCYFCGRADKGLRLKTPKSYIDELELLFYTYHADYVFEIGDDFLQDEHWLREVVHRYRRRFQGRDPRHLKIFARANRITPAVIPLLKALHVDEVAIGFESGCPNVLKTINKRITPEQNLAAAELLFSNGIDTIASFILGLPGENSQSRRLTYEHALKVSHLAHRHLGHAPQEVIANLIEINPGSPAFRKLKRRFPEKYQYQDLLSIQGTQNDLFRIQFDLHTDGAINELRRELAYWGDKINQLGQYTYPAGWMREDISSTAPQHLEMQI